MRKRKNVTLLFIPHDGGRTIGFKLPVIGLIGGVVLGFIVVLFALISTTKIVDYHSLKKDLAYYQKNTSALKAKYDKDIGTLKITLAQLRKTENELKNLVNMGSREKIIKSVSVRDNVENTGSIEIGEIEKEIEKRLNSVEELKLYLKEQKSIYLSTPIGYPVKGYLSSGFGWRIHPITKKRSFHTGVDIVAASGTPIHCTADGIVSYEGKTKYNGNFIVVEHGYGFSTVYAHNARNLVKTKQRVKRGDIIAYLGSTGRTTGPHLHYEVWRNRKKVNPLSYLNSHWSGRDVRKK
jgi:murein DD-endopeptidase MepM/ murein hydrolase activator NlpD